MTGHPKGAAAAWMLNGICQSLLSGRVPGNRNADNIDTAFKKYHHIVYNCKTVRTAEIRAGLLKSFGFGQAGAEVLIVHPDYILGALDEATYQCYVERRQTRAYQAYKHFQNTITDKQPLMKIKDHAPYSAQDEERVYLDPTARASYNDKSGSWHFKSSSSSSPSFSSSPIPPTSSITTTNTTQTTTTTTITTPSVSGAKPSAAVRLEVSLREAAEGMREKTDKGIGVDCEQENNINISDEGFLERNFTENEIIYCKSIVSPCGINSKFAGRWAAKEAVLKAISNSTPNARNLWKGSAASLKDIEIIPSPSGAPTVVLSSHAKQVANALGIHDIKVTITHCGDYALAQAVAI